MYIILAVDFCDFIGRKLNVKLGIDERKGKNKNRPVKLSARSQILGFLKVEPSIYIHGYSNR